MLRDFAIVATAFEVDVIEARKAGMLGVLALALGTILPFIVGAAVAMAFGYTDAISITTIGAGAITYIVGPVTGAALGADSRSSRCPSPRVCSRRCSSWLARRSSPASSVSTTPGPPWPLAV